MHHSVTPDPKAQETRTRNLNRPDTSALRQIGLDALLTRNELERLALHTDVVDVEPGAILCRAGAHPRQFVAVVDGYVDIDRSGRLRIAGPGTRIGGLELINGRAHEETVVTRTASRLVVIFGPALRWALSPSAITGWLGHAVRPDEPLTEPALVG